MKLKELLEQKKLSALQCSKKSGIPYTTLLELVNQKTSVDHCTVATFYKLSQTLGMSMDHLYEELMEMAPKEHFSTYKSYLCHRVKEEGDIGFIIHVLEQDEIRHLWRMKQYAEALYTLGMVDYLSRIHEIPSCEEYEDLRKQKLKQPLLPADVSLAEKLGESGIVKKAFKQAIPEFKRFNIIEGDIRDVI